jgi:hypothetical protein
MDGRLRAIMALAEWVTEAEAHCRDQILSP